MSTLIEIDVNPRVAVLYRECRAECRFTSKTDSDFLLFLLNSAARILSVVKEFNPVLDLPSESVTFTAPTPANETPSPTKPPESITTNKITDYEEMLLDEIEKSSDIETLQKYIDTVQNSLHTADNMVNGSNICDSILLKQEENAPSVSLDVSGHNESENIPMDSSYLDQLPNLEAVSPPTTDAEGSETLKCSLCSVTFKNQRNLSRHIRLGICLQGTFNCSICDHTFTSERGLKRHLHRTMCKKRALEENLIPNTSKFLKLEKMLEAPESFVCDKCNFKFSTKAALAQHTSSSRCDSNRLQGISPTEPKQQESFKCHHCKSTLASKAGLAKHLKRGQCRLYPCSNCNQAFRYLHELRTHMRQEHMTDEINTSLTKTFLRIGGLPSMTHSTNILDALSSISLQPPTVHQCKICKYTGMCKRSLENHMRMHVRQLKAIGDSTKCTQCNFSAEKDDLLNHYITQHPGLPYFKMAPKGSLVIRSNRLTASAGSVENGAPVADSSQTAAIMSVIEKLDLEKFGTSDMKGQLSKISSEIGSDYSTSDGHITVDRESGTESPTVIVDNADQLYDILRTETANTCVSDEVSGHEDSASVLAAAALVCQSSELNSVPDVVNVNTETSEVVSASGNDVS